MSERAMQFWVGAVVLAALVVMTLLVMLFQGGASMMPGGGYTLKIVFPEAPGVTRGVPVLKSGIRIGRVEEVTFDEEERNVLVTVRIDAGRKVYADEECYLTKPPLFGEVALEFKPGGAVVPVKNVQGADGKSSATRPKRRELGPEDNPIAGKLSGDLSQFAELKPLAETTMRELVSAGRQLEATMREADELIKRNRQPLGRAIDHADRTLTNIDQTFHATNDIFGDAKFRADLKKSLEELPGMIAHLSKAFGQVESALSDLQAITRPLGENGPELAANVGAVVRQANTVTARVCQLTEDLNSTQSSLGLLIRSPELYNRLNRSAKNIEDLTRQLQPIVDDARVFTDKIARHPETLGVRGALQRSPGIK